MAGEREVGITAPKTVRRAGINVVDLFTHHISAETKSRLVRKGMERIVAATQCVYPVDYKRKVQKAVLKGGAMYAQTHERNSDFPVGVNLAAEGMKFANEVLPQDRQIPGIISPFAYSLESGAQGEMSELYDDGIGDLKKIGLEPNPTPTDSDLRKGRVTKEVYDLGRRKAGIRMARAVLRENKIILVAPEASVQSGDINPNTGKPYGMVELDYDALYVSLRVAAAKTGIATLFIISISNGLGVLNSQNIPTKRATFVSLLPDRIFPKLRRSAAIMKATVSEPIEFTATEIEVVGPALINQRIGRAMAEPLKPKERGVYGEPK